jgi:tripartite ATP-independent transporter DctM subunit
MSRATGTLAAAGTIGALIPPSILMIIFGVVAQVSISDLFLGGIGAGLATALTYIIVILIRVKLNPELAPPVTERYTLAQKMASLKETVPLLALVIGVLGGMFAGLFTATQAGAVGALLSFVVAAFNRTLTREAVTRSITETLTTCGSLFIVIIGASMLTRFLTLTGLGEAISGVVTDLNTGPIMLIVGMTLVYLLLGMFLEPIGAMLITLPIFLPLVAITDMSLIWFGVYVVKLLEIGMVTPPVGMNVFVISSTVGKTAPTDLVFRGVLWFFVADIILLVFLVAFPGIIMAIPNWI